MITIDNRHKSHKAVDSLNYSAFYVKYLLFGFLCLCVGCIQEFIPVGIAEERGVLVIDGTIQDGESVFYLSYSMGISDSLDGSEFINNATVYVESNDGMRITAILSGNGKYIAQTAVLDTLREYRLSATINGRTCESEFLKPTISVEIDSVFPVKPTKLSPVEICVATHDPINRSNYYRWQFRETWEVRTELYANARYLEDENGKVIDWDRFILHNQFTSENTYTCWGRDTSNTFLIASTEKLSENRITQQTLITIPNTHDKLSRLYRIEVEQMQLREAAFRYFTDVKERSERTGDIFSPVLTSGLRGNIYWCDNSEDLIIGYIEVATVTTKDRYIWESEGLYIFPGFHCIPNMSDSECFGCFWWRHSLSNSNFDRSPPDAFYFAENPNNLHAHIKANRRCVDCRLKEKATKLRPPGWPTNSL